MLSIDQPKQNAEGLDARSIERSFLTHQVCRQCSQSSLPCGVYLLWRIRRNLDVIVDVFLEAAYDDTFTLGAKDTI